LHSAGPGMRFNNSERLGMNEILNEFARLFGRERMNRARWFSLLAFLPLYVPLLLPLVFLLPNGIMLTLIAILDPDFPIVDALAYDRWVIGPVLIALLLYCLGLWVHAALRGGGYRRILWIAIWAVFSIGSFIAFWFDIFLIGSVGASDTELILYVRMTAIAAGVVTILFQGFVIPWLLIVSKAMFNGQPQMELSSSRL